MHTCMKIQYLPTNMHSVYIKKTQIEMKTITVYNYSIWYTQLVLIGAIKLQQQQRQLSQTNTG